MMHISFFGATQEVTGSCFLVESGATKILIDCGLFQSAKFCDLRNYEKFPFDPTTINALCVSHAHIDHTGRIPKLVKEGFRGPIYSTPATRELAELMLKDSTGVLQKESVREKCPQFYTEEDVDRALEHWEDAPYHAIRKVKDATITFFNSGHILGAAMIVVELGGEKILFSGDLGNSANPLLAQREPVAKPTVLVTEATYGDRVHEDIFEKKVKLERAIEASVLRGGVLMIPAFSLERTQDLISEIAGMMARKQIPTVPIFLDSPLSIRATAIYEKYLKTPFFSLPNVHFTLTTEESKKINDVPAPKIIIAGSGMSTGGRIIHHERRYLRDPKSTLLFVSYQAPNSLGRRIQDGAESVTIFGEEVPVNCHKETIHGYSAHPDRDMLFEFIRDEGDVLKKVFMVHAEPRASLALVQTVRDYLALDASAPKYGEIVEI